MRLLVPGTDLSFKSIPAQTQKIQATKVIRLGILSHHGQYCRGWRVGRDISGTDGIRDRNVDLLLALPGEDNYHVAPVHAIIKIHPRSGALLLAGATPGRPIRYKLPDRRPVELDHLSTHVIFQRYNSFRIGSLSYTLVFSAFNPDEYGRFVEKRNEILRHYGFGVPHPSLSTIWQQQVRKDGHAILHGSFGYGGFGWVLAGVDASTGAPLAIKRHSVKTAEQARDVPGLMPILWTWCQHDGERPCTQYPHDVFTSSPLAMNDFSELDFSFQSQWSTRDVIEFLRGPLKGLDHLHRAGYMHRDVTAKNIFVMSFNPPRAVLGDLGKAIRAERHQDQRLGPKRTLAPEVDGFRLYDAAIDIWSFGVVLVCAFNPYPNRCFRMSDEWHPRVMQWLHEKQREGAGFDRSVAELLLHILARDPQRRPSAAAVLRHPCFTQGNLPQSGHPTGAKPSLGSSSHAGVGREQNRDRRGHVDPRPRRGTVSPQFPAQPTSPPPRSQYFQAPDQSPSQQQTQRQYQHPHPNLPTSRPPPPPQSVHPPSSYAAPPIPYSFNPPHQRSWNVQPGSASNPTTEASSSTSATGQSWLDFHRQQNARRGPPPPPPGAGGLLRRR
ncbi:MAG: hypothetical protein Q9170_006517 [Blastenia crenularia]